MAVGVYLPVWGQQMEEGRVVKWLLSEGDRVATGDALVEIETEKINNVVESPATGILAKIVANENDVVKITGLLAVILEEGEDRSMIESIMQQMGARQERPKIPTTVLEAREVAMPTSAPVEIKASPLVKSMAKEYGIDLKVVKGTGPDGMIVKRDILSLVEAKEKIVQKPMMAEGKAENQVFEGEVIPLSQTRKVITRRTLESIKAPQGTLTREVDLSEILKFRKSVMADFEKRYGVRLGLTPLFIKATALAVKEVPIINSRMEDDNIYISHKVHIGIVVGRKDGIIIPVIFNAQTKSLGEIAVEWQGLSKRAEEGNLGLDQITGSTITISNVGNAGIDVFTPILNPPNAAVLGITRTRNRPIVKDGQIVIGEMTYLCLTGDHRIFDAEPIGNFLVALEKIIQNPLNTLL